MGVSFITGRNLAYQSDLPDAPFQEVVRTLDHPGIMPSFDPYSTKSVMKEVAVERHAIHRWHVPGRCTRKDHTLKT